MIILDKDKKEKLQEAMKRRQILAMQAKKEHRSLEMAKSIIANDSTKIFFSSRGIEIGLEDKEEGADENYVRMTLKEFLEKVDNDMHQ